MTIEQILEDIKSDRIKTCIHDSDMADEIDDQFAFAYCLGSKRIKLVSATAEPNHGDYYPRHETGMEKCYYEIHRIKDVCGPSAQNIPIFKGTRTQFTDKDGYAPKDSPAARNIIETVMKSKDIVYVLATGPCPNVTSAILLEPAIKEKMCVIWLGGNLLEHEPCWEFNLIMDYAAGQILLNSGVPLVLIPSQGPKDVRNSAKELVIGMESLKAIKGNGRTQIFFRDEFPMLFVRWDNMKSDISRWRRVLWDVAAPGVLAVPEAFDLKVIPAPIFGDDGKYAFDSTRHKIIYMNGIDADAVLKDCFEFISRL